MNSMGESSDFREGVVVVVRRADRFLMIRRAEGLLAAGWWCFVGGGIDAGETQEEAVVREFREEVGGSVRPVKWLWEYWRPDRKLRLHWWLAAIDGEDLRANPSEVQEFGWFQIAEIDALPQVLESNREFLSKFGGILTEQEIPP